MNFFFYKLNENQTLIVLQLVLAKFNLTEHVVGDRKVQQEPLLGQTLEILRVLDVVVARLERRHSAYDVTQPRHVDGGNVPLHCFLVLDPFRPAKRIYPILSKF